MSLPAKATKSLSHRFPSATRHFVYPALLNAVRNDFSALLLRNGILFEDKTRFHFESHPKTQTTSNGRTEFGKNHSTIFAQGEVRENPGRTHSHTVNTFLFQHERLRGSKCPHLPQDKPKNDSTKSKTQKNRSGRFASLRAGCREPTASFPQIRFPENRGRGMICIGRKRRRKSGRPRYVS